MRLKAQASHLTPEFALICPVATLNHSTCMSVDLVVHLDKTARLWDAVTDEYDGSTSSSSTTMSTVAAINGNKIDTVNLELAQMNHRIISLARSDGQNHLSFKTIEQRLEQLELTKHQTPNDTEDDAERSNAPDTAEATITKFLQEVLQRESLPGQAKQPRAPNRRRTLF